VARLAVAGVVALLAVPAPAAAAVQQPRTHYAAALGGVSFDARLTRRSAVGTVTLRDGRELPFSAKAGDGGGVVGRRFMHQGRRYRYGGSPPTAWNDCGNVAAERELLRAQRGLLLTQSGVWESRTNANRGPTSADYNRLNQAIGVLDEAIFALDERVYDCA